MLLVAAAATTACEQNAVQQIAGPAAGGVNVKFFNFSVGSPAVNFFVNDAKATAVSATGCAILDDTNRQQCLSTGLESTTGVVYGGAGNGASAWYSDVAPGQVTIAGKIAAVTDKNLAISNIQTTVETGKFYSYYLSGIYDTAAKSTDSFIVEDVMPPSGDFTTSYVRFVNASSTATGPMTLWLKERTTRDSLAIGGPVAYKSAGAFVAVPVRRPLPDSAGITGRSAANSWDLAARYAGSPTAIFSRNQLSFGGGRAYTITARGNVAVTSTMSLDNTANR
ncbi:MAG TPA: hypothetical protein VF117_03085 [Gammaproteobacteria bacterium]